MSLVLKVSEKLKFWLDGGIKGKIRITKVSGIRHLRTMYMSVHNFLAVEKLLRYFSLDQLTNTAIPWADEWNQNGHTFSVSNPLIYCHWIIACLSVWFPHGCSQLPRIGIYDSECLLKLYVHSTQNYKPQVIVDSQLKKSWSRFPDSTCELKWTNPFVYIDLIKGEFVSLNCSELLRHFFMETHTQGRVSSELYMHQLYSLTSGCLSIPVSLSDHHDAFMGIQQQNWMWQKGSNVTLIWCNVRGVTDEDKC